MIRFASAAALALVVSACAPRPPVYDYAIIMTLPPHETGKRGAGR